MVKILFYEFGGALTGGHTSFEKYTSFMLDAGFSVPNLRRTLISSIIKGVRESTLSVGKSRARNPTQNPTQFDPPQTDPNQNQPNHTKNRSFARRRLRSARTNGIPRF